MLYYKYQIGFMPSSANEGEELDSDFSYRRGSNKYETAITELNMKQDYNVRMYISSIRGSEMTLCAVIGYKNTKNPKDLARKFAEDLGFNVTSIEGGEVTLHDFAELVRNADRNGFINDDDRVLEMNAWGSYRACASKMYRETVVEACDSDEELLERAKTLHCGNSLVEEVKRILSVSKDKFMGHPVQYILNIDNLDLATDVAKLIVASLAKVGRLRSRRIIQFKATKPRGFSLIGMEEDEVSIDQEVLHGLYSVVPGGSIMVVPNALSEETQYADECSISCEAVAASVVDTRRDCLSFVVFHRNDFKAKDRFMLATKGVRFVEISEEAMDQHEARVALADKAKADGIDECSKLLDRIPDNVDAMYNLVDVNRIYNEWMDNRLSTEVFPQYRDVKLPTVAVDSVFGDASSKLESMIGIDRAKDIVRKAVIFNKVQAMYAQRGFIQREKPCRHMVFTGNPGTAKTTVARLFARIMKDNKVLSVGDLVEVGRQDLVGKYVGWTAKLVEHAFERAKGSVLFIDEAYSLCEEKGGMYGDEAINTIVQLMENHREDTIVIFAGYPDKMEQFLDKNPGLRSRIAFNVNFDDYSEDQLVDILSFIASENGFKLADGVDSKVRLIVGQAMKKKDFGNGRYMRNLFEKARMNQAFRFSHLSSDKLSMEAISTLEAEDFDGLEEVDRNNDCTRIGFAC